MSIGDIARYVFKKLEINLPIGIDTNYYRPQELDFLRGDSSKIRALGWVPEFTTEQTLGEMINHWLKLYE